MDKTFDKKLKIALVHEFFTQMGGAEKVIQEFLDLYPEAVVHTLIYSSEKTGYLFDYYKIKTSFLQKLPGAKNWHRWYLPLMPLATESFNFSNYDIVLADSSAFAKGVKPPKSTLFICYCHTPTRYLWLESKQYVKSLNLPGIIKVFIPLILSWLRIWDLKASTRPDFYIANSKTVQKRIKKIYGRASEVVFPPVDTEFFHPVGSKENYFFAASRLEPYKKIELVVKAFNDLGLPLKIAGSGTASTALRKIAKPNIEFLGRITDEELRRRYSESRAFIFPANEDAGIMPVEAMSCGTPVIAYGVGGVKETVVDNKTGIFFEKQTAQSIKEAVLGFNSENFDRDIIRAHALQFDKKIFKQKISSLIDNWYQEWKKK